MKPATPILIVLALGAGGAVAAPDWQAEGAAMAEQLASQQEQRWQRQERLRVREQARAEQAEAEQRRLRIREQSRQRTQGAGRGAFSATNSPRGSTLSRKGPG